MKSPKQEPAIPVAEFRRQRWISAARWRALVINDEAPPIIRRGSRLVIAVEAARRWDEDQRVRMAAAFECPVVGCVISA